ncbi:MAG: hypothetical protein L0Y35_01875 [Flammeovirgaceae bacterium]|nr:hypothetical protein [Flammeovirgaceae bacterium]
MKTPVITFILLAGLSAQAQTLVGSWQVVKQSSCLESKVDDLSKKDEDMKELLSDFGTMSNRTQQVVMFNDNQTGQQSTKTVREKKATNTVNFLYKYDGSNIYFLDKKSRTITSTFTVEKLTYDSLIYSNSSRPCETKVLIRIK